MGVNEQQELYHLFIQHIDDFGVFLIDADGCVATWELGAERVLGYKKGEIIGQHIARFYTEEEITRGVPEQELRDARTNGKASDDRWLVRNDGTKIWVNGVTVVLHVGASVFFGKIIRDHTTMRHNAERLVKLNQQLVSSVQKLEDSQRELKEKVLEMERFEEVVVGRELKMMELEKQVKEMRKTMEAKVPKV